MGNAQIRGLGTIGVVRIVHAGGRVEEYRRPVSAGDIMILYPRHYVAATDFFRSSSGVLLPQVVLVPGSKYFLVPHHTVYRKLLRLTRENTCAAGTSGISHVDSSAKDSRTAGQASSRKSSTKSLHVRRQSSLLVHKDKLGRERRPKQLSRRSFYARLQHTQDSNWNHPTESMDCSDESTHTRSESSSRDSIKTSIPRRQLPVRVSHKAVSGLNHRAGQDYDRHSREPPTRASVQDNPIKQETDEELFRREEPLHSVATRREHHDRMSRQWPGVYQEERGLEQQQHTMEGSFKEKLDRRGRTASSHWQGSGPVHTMNPEFGSIKPLKWQQQQQNRLKLSDHLLLSPSTHCYLRPGDHDDQPRVPGSYQRVQALGQTKAGNTQRLPRRTSSSRKSRGRPDVVARQEEVSQKSLGSTTGDEFLLQQILPVIRVKLRRRHSSKHWKPKLSPLVECSPYDE